MYDREVVNIFHKLTTQVENMLGLGLVKGANDVNLAALELAQNALVLRWITKEQYDDLEKSTYKDLREIFSCR